jgi:hypothetical protein
LGYADNNWLRLYDVQLDVLPGVKWRFAPDWLLAVQASLPLVSQGWTFEDDRYRFVRLSTAAISRQLHFEEARQHLKLSAGLFGSDRWGADVKWMMPVTDWLMLQAQAGYTNNWLLGFNFKGRGLNTFNTKWVATFQGGARLFLKPWNLELRASGGRYVNEDYGMQADVLTHFRHCSVNLFYQLRMGKRLPSAVDEYTDRSNGGFKIIVMLPPYGKSRRVEVGCTELRPASNFRLTNNVRSDGRSMKTYETDPEENERQLPIDVKWGIEEALGQNE